ncbi:Protein of unknown function [Rhodoblastus acidophilus]|uniref:DUF3618 domain-containing protein n=1 Tax=Rhodoblastus acidophilus TaxID=1074 RepID=A0A212Q5G1_RHOAC|nr:DUF3618 domain-containing protein [Rhodoblastus acidophilus]PPQ36357.1 DUF3618 domain-containing protein [Rhodoblastus acidophilus]RAI19743.1 DUF3618 domain-containing protein [Rhodoblastus acidophilus]SNB54514.1 Protein of unknown function [Rhodoblastus acidophilus]
MTYAEQLEHETEGTRRRVAETLHELREVATPGHVLDEVMERFGLRDGDGALLAGNFKRQLIENPMAAALVGAGVAWLVWGQRSSAAMIADSDAESVGDSVRSAAESASDTASDLASDMRRRAGGAAEKARQTGDAMRAGAGSALDGSALDTVRGAASTGYKSVSDGARSAAHGVAASARAARSQTVRSGGAFVDFCREQPLVLAGLGLAIGAAVGALAPQSRAEKEALADAGADLKDSMGAQADDLRDAAERAVDAAASAFDGRSKPSGDTRGEKTRANESSTDAADQASDPAPQAARTEG